MARKVVEGRRGFPRGRTGGCIQPNRKLRRRVTVNKYCAFVIVPNVLSLRLSDTDTMICLFVTFCLMFPSILSLNYKCHHYI
jgi:hypothetical protein